MGSKTVTEVATVTVPTIQVILDFKRFGEKKFEPFLAKVYQCSMANPYKTVPQNILDVCKQGRDEYVTARTNRDANPNPANTQFLEAAYIRAGDAYEVLAKWVEANCDDAVAIALSFGFSVAKPMRHAATQLSAPVKVEYEYGMPSTIVFKCKSLGRNIRYMVECSIDGGQNFQICGMSSKSFRIVAESLVRSKEYIFRIYGVNAAGNGFPWNSGGLIAAV